MSLFSLPLLLPFSVFNFEIIPDASQIFKISAKNSHMLPPRFLFITIACILSVPLTHHGCGYGYRCCSCLVAESYLTLLTAARQTPLSMRFPRQEYWSELPVPSPGDLPDPGITLTSPALASGFFTTEPPGKPWIKI